MPDAEILNALGQLIYGFLFLELFLAFRKLPRPSALPYIVIAFLLTAVISGLNSWLRSLASQIAQVTGSIGKWNANTASLLITAVGLWLSCRAFHMARPRSDGTGRDPASGWIVRAITWLAKLCRKKDIPDVASFRSKFWWAVMLAFPSKQDGYPHAWEFAFDSLDRWVILRLKDGRSLFGWPIRWPDSPDTGHFLLESPDWLDDNGDSTGGLETTEAMLVPANTVLLIEFVAWDSDVDSTDPILDVGGSDGQKDSQQGYHRED